ncbi:MAG: hypothetical protein WAQ08_02560 [Aquabacterium sp.]|jgi:hypothetical protein|uniref:hypothetical protein n=1 Tax=Aquabacterium sp. TaxID=1872578 RepID=UPI003BB0FBF8
MPTLLTGLAMTMSLRTAPRMGCVEMDSSMIDGSMRWTLALLVLKNYSRLAEKGNWTAPPWKTRLS